MAPYITYQKKSVFYQKQTTFTKPILFTEQIPLIVGFGTELSDRRFQIATYEQWSDDMEYLMEKADVFLFTEEYFRETKFDELIDSLITHNKTVLFYGHRMNLEELLKGREELFPIYTVDSSKEIFHFMYGYGYSKSKGTNMPIAIMGNIREDKLERYISNYLYKYLTEEL